MPEGVLIVVNPAAGGGRGRRVAARLASRIGGSSDVRITVTSAPGDATAMAAAASRDGHCRVVAVGGDGTVQEVINGLLAAGAPSAVELGIVPVGTGNDLARGLALPRDLDAALAAALGSAVRPIDVGLARNGDGTRRWFGSAGGIGFDAQVAGAMARRRGWHANRLGYLITTLSELRRFDNRHLRLSIDGAVLERDALFVAIANGPFYGGGMRIAPEAAFDDGRLDLCVVGDISRVTALRQLPNLYRGTHVRHPAVEMRRCATLRVEGDAPTLVHLDGEPFGGLPLEVTLATAAVRVAVR